MMENAKRQMNELYKKDCNMYNVGAMLDYMNFTPRTLDEIIEKVGKEKADEIVQMFTLISNKAKEVINRD